MTVPYIPVQRGTQAPLGGWRAHAACRGTDPLLFFPASTTDATAVADVDRAKSICAACPVRAACLDWALATGARNAVLGGTTWGERRALSTRRSPRSVPRAAR